jgi:hypothetical protein
MHELYDLMLLEGVSLIECSFFFLCAQVKFEAGSALAHIKIQILDDQNWDPIRDFSVQIDSIIQGNGIIGKLSNWKPKRDLEQPAFEYPLRLNAVELTTKTDGHI